MRLGDEAAIVSSRPGNRGILLGLYWTRAGVLRAAGPIN